MFEQDAADIRAVTTWLQTIRAHTLLQIYARAEQRPNIRLPQATAQATHTLCVCLCVCVRVRSRGCLFETVFRFELTDYGPRYPLGLFQMVIRTYPKGYYLHIYLHRFAVVLSTIQIASSQRVVAAAAATTGSFNVDLLALALALALAFALDG